MTYISNKDYHLSLALSRIEDQYGDIVSIDNKKKSLIKFGQNESVGTTSTTIMQLATGVHEILVASNLITSVVSSSASDTGSFYYEGHTISGSDASFSGVTNGTNLTGQTIKTLDTALFRITRARMLTSPAVGTIYFYEGGAVSGGVPTDLTKVHTIIKAGDVQTQKASTTTSSSDYWFIDSFTASVLKKTASFAQFRIESKPITGTLWYPQTQWVSVSNSSGTVQINLPEILIIPKNYDVRLVAIADGAGTHLSGGMSGWLGAIV